MAESTAYARRGHSGAAKDTTLVSGITSGATSLDAGDLSTWTAADDNGPGRATITDGTNEEEVEFTAVSGNSLTGLTRGVGGTTAQAWSPGVTISHRSSARDFDEANYTAAETVGKITAANQILASDGANSFSALAVAASRIVGRKATGDIAALTAAEVVALLQGSDLAEYIADTVGAMFTGNTETNVTVTYQDADNTIDVEVSASGLTDLFMGAPALAATSGTPTLTNAIAGPHGVAWLLDSASTEVISGSVLIPTGWSTVDLEVFWYNAGAGSGNVRFDRYLISTGDTETISGPGGSESTVAAAAQSVLKKSTLQSGFSVTAGEVVQVSLWRVGGNAADTLGNDIGVLGFNLHKAS